MEGKGESAGRDRQEIASEDEAPGPSSVGPGRRHSGGGSHRTRHRRRSRAVVAALALAAGVGGALAGCHPTGTAALDALYPGLLAALVTVAASRASRASVLILATIAAVMSRGWLLAPAGAALALAFGAVFPRRAYQRLGALIGALAVQVVLRWTPLGFHGLTALVAVVAVVPVLSSAWYRQHRRWKRATAIGAGALLGGAVVLSLPVAIGGLLARAPVDRGIAATHRALTAASGGDAALATSQLRAAGAALNQAHTDTGSWWTLGANLVPVVAQQRRAVAGATAAVRTLAAGAGDEAASLDFHKLTFHQGRIDLAAIAALRGPLVALDGQVAAAQRALADPPSGWLAAPIATRLGHLSQELAKARNSADLGVEAVQDAPALLGGDRVRHYFVAFMTPAESRGLDGFIGAFGELTVDHGHIGLTRSGQIGQLNTVLASAAPKLTGVAQYLARYGAFAPASHFQDVTYSPDFPTVAKVITEMYPQAGGDHIDGVLALDPEALSVLLRFTGPITVAGLPTPLTAANATAVLLRQQYTTFPTQSQQVSRHDFLQDALQQAFGKISSGSLPDPRTLSTALSAVVHQGRVLFWSDHPPDQPLLHRIGVDGALPQPGPVSDLLAVTVSNAANNKIDAYLHEQVTDQVTYDPATGHVGATVTLSLQNAAPSSGLPAYVIGDNAGAGFPSGTNFLWLSVYSPLDLVSSTLGGRPVIFSPGTPELGVKGYSTFVHIPAESTATLTLTFDGHVNPGPAYRMTLRLQPLVNTPAASFIVSPSPGWKLGAGTPASWPATANEIQTHSWTSRR